MQIIESTVWKVRAARLSLVNPSSPIEITLFPMVHVGEPAFYETVYADAFSHDIVLVEGVNSPIANRITRSYRWIEGSKTIDLKVQPRYPSPESCRANIIHADLTGEEFLHVWRTVPLWLRLAVHIFTPLIGAQFRWFGSREKLAKHMTLDDLPRPDELLDFSLETAALTRAIVDARDDRLLQRLAACLDNPESGIRSLAIVYGAQHMRAVIRELKSRYGYIVNRGDWITIFNY